MRQYVFAYFNDAPGSERDKLANAIMTDRGGRPIGAGTFLPTGERDVQYEFTDPENIESARKALERAGFRVAVKDAPPHQESAQMPPPQGPQQQVGNMTPFLADPPDLRDRMTMLQGAVNVMAQQVMNLNVRLMALEGRNGDK